MPGAELHDAEPLGARDPTDTGPPGRPVAPAAAALIALLHRPALGLVALIGAGAGSLGTLGMQPSPVEMTTAQTTELSAMVSALTESVEALRFEVAAQAEADQQRLVLLCALAARDDLSSAQCAEFSVFATAGGGD